MRRDASGRPIPDPPDGREPYPGNGYAEGGYPDGGYRDGEPAHPEAGYEQPPARTSGPFENPAPHAEQPYTPWGPDGENHPSGPFEHPTGQFQPVTETTGPGYDVPSYPPGAPPAGAPPADGETSGPLSRVERHSGPGRRPSRSSRLPGSARRLAEPARKLSGPARRLSGAGRPGPSVAPAAPSGSKVGSWSLFGAAAATHRGANFALAGILVLVALAGAGIASRLPGAGTERTAAVADPYSSRWLCPVLPGRDASVTVANSGRSSAQLRASLSSANDAAPEQKATTTVLPTGDPLGSGAVRSLPVKAAQPGLLRVESFGAPVAVGASGQPGCASSAASRWWLPAADTSAGKVDIVLANPGSEGAVVQLVLHTNQSQPYRPAALSKIFVPGNSARSIPLNKHVGELDVSVQAVALLGRIVVGAVRTPAAGPAVTIAGQPGAQSTWSFAGGRGGKGDATVLAVTNPSQDPLVLDIRAVTGKEAFTPAGLEDLEIPSEATKRIRIEVNNAPGSGAMGLEVRSRTGAPFSAALSVQPRAGTGDTYLDTGTGRLWDRWVLPRGGTTQVAMANLGTGSITAKVTDLGNANGPGTDVPVPAGRIVVKEIKGAKGGLLVDGHAEGLVVVPLGTGAAYPAAMVNGTQLTGPVQPGPAAG